jgi:catechol 2,3-dioxygenase-like lactoylglutathione lyase family enzyme
MNAVSGLLPAHVTLGVNDLDASERFYRDGLGLEVQRGSEKLVVTFGTFALVLEAAPPAERAKFTFGFRVTSVALLDAIAERARKSGGQVLAGPAAREGGVALLLMDPDHYQLEILAPSA